VRSYPAIDVEGGATDVLLVIVDDFSPAAIEEHDDAVRLFFSTDDARNAALAALAAAHYSVAPLEVSDEDWARRSQDNLAPITVGRITVAPPWASDPEPLVSSPQPVRPSLQALRIVIQPSMGFGTGHHATTRLCLAALQQLDVRNREVVDVGTGSGILAIAAEKLGAQNVLGIDNDPDAIQSANENLTLNPDVHQVQFRIMDLMTVDLPRADVLIANLTGALLVRAAPRLTRAVREGGVLILSGLLSHERDVVSEAYREHPAIWEAQEDEWLGLARQASPAHNGGRKPVDPQHGLI
jgi:ribosomal protein L11 methyltransferase